MTETPVIKRKVMRFVSSDEPAIIQPPPPLVPASRMKRSDSLTGLSSLHKGVTDLENIVTQQTDALRQSIEQIKLQDALIKEYQQRLEEHDAIIDKIVYG